MKILLVNLDSMIPNLALEKLKIFHSLKGDEVRQIRDEENNVLPYPLLLPSYDKIYVSCIFKENKSRCDKWEGIGDKVEVGGSGYSLTKNLPKEIDDIKPHINMGFTTRGCIRKCIDGNTLINTIEGNLPIKNIVGREIGVWTYNPKTGEAYITKATKIWKNGRKDCVKVTFDDGSHIICTPDHRFLTFKNENQYVERKEIEKEAKDLKPKDSVIALKYYYDDKYGIHVHWRHKNILEHQAVMEYLIGRKLKKKEVIHHLDRNRFNNSISNLALCKSSSDHFTKFHNEEIRQIMIESNPMKNQLTIEKVIETRKERYPKGTWHRTYEQRLTYRNSKLGKNNPNYKDGKTAGRISRLPAINHKVVSVEYVGKRDVYDMYVPETNWFFANNVLVHNCYFCVVPQKEGKIKVVGDIYDLWDGKSKEIIIMDNNILAAPEHFFKICGQLKKENLKVDFNQGLDHRILTDDICKELLSLTYRKGIGGKIRFAFDDIHYKPTVLKALKMLRKNGLQDWGTRWYVYVGVKDSIENVMERINLLRDQQQAVFLMRDRDPKVQNDEVLKKIYVWTNHIEVFSKHTFENYDTYKKDNPVSLFD